MDNYDVNYDSSRNTVLVPNTRTNLVVLSSCGINQEGGTLGMSWLRIDLESKTFKSDFRVHPNDVIVTMNSIVINEMLISNKKDVAWMKYGKDYIFANEWYMSTSDYKKRI